MERIRKRILENYLELTPYWNTEGQRVYGKYEIKAIYSPEARHRFRIVYNSLDKSASVFSVQKNRYLTGL